MLWAICPWMRHVNFCLNRAYRWWRSDAAASLERQLIAEETGHHHHGEEGCRHHGPEDHACGVHEQDADEVMEDVRRRDEQRLELQLAEGINAGSGLMRNNTITPQPTPLITPAREGRALNEEAEEILERSES